MSPHKELQCYGFIPLVPPGSMLGKQGEGRNHSAEDPERRPVAAPGAGAAVWLVMGQHMGSMPRARALGVPPTSSSIETLSLTQKRTCSVAARGNHPAAVTALSLCCPDCLQIWILWSLITSVNALSTLVPIHQTEQCVCQQEYLLGQSMI